MDRRAPNRVASSHHTSELSPYTFAFHDGDEIGPAMLARIAKETGLKPEDL